MTSKIYSDLLTLAGKSGCMKMKVGAIILHRGEVIAQGYNEVGYGLSCRKVMEIQYSRRSCLPPSSPSPTFEEWLKTDAARDFHREWSKNTEVHAEANALVCISRFEPYIDEYEMYCLYSPCTACVKDIIAHGIRKFYYFYDYKCQEGIMMMEKAGIQVQKLVAAN
jgi:dCMP deaminase